MSKRWIVVLIASFMVGGLVIGMRDVKNETMVIPLEDREEPALTDKPVQIFAHRGAKDRANEATLAAYDLAVQDGVDALEIDLRMTKDGILVAMHDETIDRTTNGTGKVEGYTLEELKHFKTVGYFNGVETLESIPTLEEVFGKYKGETFYIETRPVAENLKMEETLIELLNEYGLIESKRVMLQSFSEASLEKLTGMVPDLPMTKLTRSGEFNLDEALLSPYPSIGVEAGDLLEADVKTLQAAGKEVHVYFTNSETEQEEQKRVTAYGIDGLFTDQIEFTKKLGGAVQ